MPVPARSQPWPNHAPSCHVPRVRSTSVDAGATSCAANDLASTVEVPLVPGQHYFIVVGKTNAEDDAFPLQLSAALQSL